jgi:hypothetical protein
MNIIKPIVGIVMGSVVLVGCVNLPSTNGKVVIDSRQYRYAYKHVIPSLADGVLPPPDPKNYFSDDRRSGYINPNLPYIEDLRDYKDYLRRYLFRLNMAMGHKELSERIGNGLPADTPMCKKLVESMVIPKPPSEPDLDKMNSIKDLFNAYYQYSEELYSHLDMVTKSYNELLAAHGSECHG